MQVSAVLLRFLSAGAPWAACAGAAVGKGNGRLELFLCLDCAEPRAGGRPAALVAAAVDIARIAAPLVWLAAGADPRAGWCGGGGAVSVSDTSMISTTSESADSLVSVCASVARVCDAL